MKFLEFDEQKVHNDFWHLIREKASETEVLAAKKQHSRDKEIMLKLLEVNRVLREALEYYAPSNSYDYDKTQGVNYIWNDQGKRSREALAEADRMMKEIE